MQQILHFQLRPIITRACWHIRQDSAFCDPCLKIWPYTHGIELRIYLTLHHLLTKHTNVHSESSCDHYSLLSTECIPALLHFTCLKRKILNKSLYRRKPNQNHWVHFPRILFQSVTEKNHKLIMQNILMAYIFYACAVSDKLLWKLYHGFMHSWSKVCLYT